nr:copper homeostasis protein CutC [Sphingomonas sp.]
MSRVLLEICVDDLAGVRAAAEGGADRIELCSALALGGLGPSPAFAAAALESGLRVHAMVRPRAGDFVYSADELALMSAEIRALASVGVQGAVVGATHQDGRPDRDALARLRDAAAGIEIVLHRAIDLAPDPCAAVEVAASLGFDHVLSSGGARTASEGAGTLARMVEAAAGRLNVIAGSGVTADNAAELVQATSVDAVHASASDLGAWPDSRIAAFGFGPPDMRVTDASKVAALRIALG